MNLKYLIKELKYYNEVDGSLRKIFFKGIFSRTPLKHLVNTKVYNQFYENRIFKKQGSKPYILSIENTNICNAKCIMCPHSKMTRVQRVMSQQEFEKILDDVMANEPQMKFLMFTGLGEPLCDQQLEKKIKYVNIKYPNLKIIVFTNAGLLTKARSNALLKLNIFKINFSINGTGSDYNKNMGIDYDNSIRNINYFLAGKTGQKPLIHVSCMILDKNPVALEEFKKKWIDRVNSVVAYSPSTWAGAMDEINKDIVKPASHGKRWPCPNLWREIAIDAEGNMLTCHGDFDSKVKIGNLIKKDYKDILIEHKKIKSQHLCFDFSSPICQNCDNCFDSSLDWLGM